MRARAAAAAVPASARVMLRTPALALVLLGTAPAIVSTVRGARDLHLAITIAGVAAGCAFAFITGEHADSAIAASPTSLRWRHLLRSVPILLSISAAWLVVATCAAHAQFPLSPLWPRLAETAAAAALATASASFATRDGEPAGLAGAVSAFLMMGTISVVAMRYSWLPILGRPDHASRWWMVAAVAGLIAARHWRDPPR